MAHGDRIERSDEPCWIDGGRALRRPTWHAAAAWGLLALVVGAVVPGMMRSAGSFMEEGFTLVFPERLRKGDVPNVDFLYLYGPGSLHVLAAWFELVGTSLSGQRLLGLLQLLAGTAAIVVLTRPSGRVLATIAALCFLAMMLTTTGLAALAWPGALALALWGIAYGLRSRHLAGAAQRRAQFAAGVLTGLALSFRPDMVVAIGLGWLVLLAWRLPARRVAAGLLAGLLPMWVHLAIAGIGPVWQGMVVDPVVRLRPGRRLPVPPSWSYIDGALQALGEIGPGRPWWGLPAMLAERQIVAWFWFVVVANLAVPAALVVLWRRRHGQRPVIESLLVVAVVGIGLTGQALQRPDSAHLAWGGVLSFAVLAPTVALAVGGSPLRRALVPLAAVGSVLLVVCPYFTVRPYLHTVRLTVGDLPSGLEVRRGDRRFLAPDEATQAASQQAVDALAALAAPGERLLVGPADLRRTIYNDVVFYHLFPDLEPATYFIEMDPGLADLPESGLADDVRRADWLILTNFWTWWFEPNASSTFHDNGANEAVAAGFCLAGSYDNGLVLLFRRCAEGDGLDPSTIGIGPDRRATFDQQQRGREAIAASPER